MKDPVETLKEAIEAVLAAPLAMPFDESEAIMQFRAIIAIRRLWSTLPNSRLKDEGKGSFITNLLGATPSEAHLALATRGARRRRLTEDEVLALEVRQGGRCRLCGVLLVRDTSPHIDHVVPLSLGGDDDLSNFQLLCRECNLGKGPSLHWLMWLPYFDESPGNEPSARLRYSVLCRFGGRCFHKNCENNSVNSQMFVSPFIGVAEGGRIIFDNLVVYCGTHRDERIAAQMRRAKAAMSRRRAGSFGFGN